MEKLILKYEKAKQSQIDIKQQTPLTNAVQHQLLDQNIHLFDGILDDLRALAEPSSVSQANELLPHVSGRFSNDELERRADGCFLAITSYSPRNELGGIERKWIVKCIYKALKLVNDR